MLRVMLRSLGSNLEVMGGVAGACHDPHPECRVCTACPPCIAPSPLCILQGRRRLAQPPTGTTQKDRVNTLAGDSKQRGETSAAGSMFYTQPLSCSGTKPWVPPGVTSSAFSPFSGSPLCPLPLPSRQHLSDEIPAFKSPSPDPLRRRNSRTDGCWKILRQEPEIMISIVRRSDQRLQKGHPRGGWRR